MYNIINLKYLFKYLYNNKIMQFFVHANEII